MNLLKTLTILTACAVLGSCGGIIPLATTQHDTPENVPFSNVAGIPVSEDYSRPHALRPPPQAAELLQNSPLEDRAMGNPAAPVTMIEYASFTCPFCRRFHVETFPRLKREYIDTGKLYYILREFPIGRSSGHATMITRCAPKEQYFDLVSQFIHNQALWVSQAVQLEKIYSIAARTGMSKETFDKCLADKDLEQRLKNLKQRAREFGVSGTPTFFINGKKLRGILTFEQMAHEISTAAPITGRRPAP
jgi:protein-disulfide isomerase